MKDITTSAMLSLWGLQALAKKHNEDLENYVKAAMDLTGETDECGFCSDFIYCGEMSVDVLIERIRNSEKGLPSISV